MATTITHSTDLTSSPTSQPGEDKGEGKIKQISKKALTAGTLSVIDPIWQSSIDAVNLASYRIARDEDVVDSEPLQLEGMNHSPETPMDKLLYSFRKVFPNEKLEELEPTTETIYGSAIKIVLEQDAKEAFETFFKAIEEIDLSNLNITPILSWTGDTNLGSDELSDCMAKAMLETGVRPRVSEETNITEGVQEEWETKPII